MSLRLEVRGEALDLPSAFSLGMEFSSPLLNSRGSQSRTVTVPASPRNCRLLGYASRLDLSLRPLLVDAVLCDGALRRSCRLNVVTAGPDAFELSVGTDESLLYSDWQDTKLRDIPDLPVYTPSGSSLSSRVSTLVYSLMDVYRCATVYAPFTDFRVFPVAVEYREPDDDAASALPLATILNEVYRDDSGKKSSDAMGFVLYSAARDVQVGLDDEGTVHVPVGYGITPFLKVCRFLHILFSSYGYDLEETVFDTDAQLSQLVILNNTADAITAGYIDYADLLPDCTVNAFLDALYAHFGAVFYLDASTMKARCVLIRDTLAAVPAQDLTPLHRSRPVITYGERKQLVLSSQTGYTYADVKKDTFGEFLSVFRPYLDVHEHAGLLYYDRFTGMVQKNHTNPSKVDFFSSLCFPWDVKGDLAEEAVSGSDELVPLLSLPTVTGGVASVGVFSALPLFLSGVRNAHTHIKGSSVLDDDDETLEEDTDLAFCFGHGCYTTVDGIRTGLYYGSPHAYGNSYSHFIDDGGHEYTFSLWYVGTDGCYNRFWRHYDQYLRYGGRSATVDLGAGLPFLSTLDFSRPFLLFGEPVLLDTLASALPLTDGGTSSLSFRLLLPLSPFTDCSELVDDIGEAPYYWLVDDDYYAVQQSLLSQARNDAVTAHPNYVEVVYAFFERDKQLPSDLAFPSAADVSQNVVRTYTYTLVLIYEYHSSRYGLFATKAAIYKRATVTVTYTAMART